MPPGGSARGARRSSRSASAGSLSIGVPIDELILWGVPARGRSYLRELAAFGRLEASQTGETPGEGDDVRAGGHRMSAETAAAVRALDGPALAAAAPPRRVLLLGRDGVAPDAKLVGAFEAAGARVETDPGDGWGAAVAGPQFAAVPEAAVARTRAWLSGGGGAAPSTGEPRGSLVLPGVRETPLSFGPCFGVLAEPEGARRDVTAVLLNAGAIRHIGPNRMWVEAARRWAAQGVPTLRLDLESIGEAAGADTAYADEANFYTPELTTQVGPVLDALVERGLPPRFLLAGLCSGAYWAAHTADADPRVATAVLLNPRLLYWDEETEPRREVRRALSVFTPSGFRRLLTAERPLARLIAVLRYVLVSSLRRRQADVTPASATAELIERLSRRGQRAVFAFSGHEPLHDELRRSGDAERLDIRPLPLISHTLKPAEAQRAAHAVLDAALAETA